MMNFSTVRRRFTISPFTKPADYDFYLKCAKCRRYLQLDELKVKTLHSTKYKNFVPLCPHCGFGTFEIELMELMKSGEGKK